MSEDGKKEGIEESREPYEPPAVVSEEVFETLAVACGKTGGFGCASNGGINS